MGRFLYVDPAIAQANIFRPRPQTRIEERLDFAETISRRARTITFQGPHLDIADQAVFLAVLYLRAAMPRRDQKFSVEAKERDWLTPPGIEVRRTLTQLLQHKVMSDGDASKDDKLQKWLNETPKAPSWPVVQTKLYELAALAKRSASPGGTAIKAVKMSLTRLSETSIVEVIDGAAARSQLLSWTMGQMGEVSILPAWNSERAWAGKEYFTLCPSERRELEVDLAKALHFKLCGAMKNGDHRHLHPDTLLQWFYPPTETPAVQRQRRHRLKVALLDLGRLTEWTVKSKDGLVEIYRHKREWAERRKARTKAP